MAKCKSLLLKAFSGIQLRITGHSLGGALAQLITLVAYPMRAIVFNSPGCGQMPGIDKTRASLIYNINSRYGFINKIGVTLGKVFLIDIPEDEKIANAVMERFAPAVDALGSLPMPDDLLIKISKFDTSNMSGTELMHHENYNNTVTITEYIVNTLLEVEYKRDKLAIKIANYTQAAVPKNAIIEQCGANPRIWEATKLLLASSSDLCHLLYIFSLSWAIYQQHNMKNVIKTLQMEKYLSLAHRTL